MTKEIIISEQENIAATFENGKITEFFMNEGEQLVGDIILGKVDSTIQSIDAAFVSIGKNRNGFIHITDLCLKNAKKRTGIRNHLQPKQNILVQIAKEATGSKGPRLTGMLTIPGKYMVLTPYERKVGISKKITDTYERDRLVYISKKICQSGYGIIVRTEAIGQSEEALKEDLDFLLKRWNEILKMSETMQAPAVLYRDQDLLYRVLRDAVSPDVDKIVVDSADARARSIDLLQSWSHNAFRLVQQNRNPIPLSHQYNIFGEIEKVLQPKAPLPSGGYLVIEKTEALTVIDVNSGSTKGTSGLNETILQTNKEAAVEIARQLKLRDIGGVIIIDFIDMLDQRDQQIVWQILANAVKNDKAQPQLGYFSEFSLLEMTRHRQKKSIIELLTTKCPYCDGVGHLRNNVYRSDLLTPDSVRKRVNRFDENDRNKAGDPPNNRKMDDLTGNVEYVENRMNRIPPHVTKHRKENVSSNQISYPKYDRNNNRYDDNLEINDEIENTNEQDQYIESPDVEVVDIQDNIPQIDPESIVEEVYESLAEPETQEIQEESTENFVVELTKEERMYIEAIEDPSDRRKPHFKDNKFGKNKKDFNKKDRFNRHNNNNRYNNKFSRSELDLIDNIEGESESFKPENHKNDRFSEKRNDRYNQRDNRFPKNRFQEEVVESSNFDKTEFQDNTYNENQEVIIDSVEQLELPIIQEVSEIQNDKNIDNSSISEVQNVEETHKEEIQSESNEETKETEVAMPNFIDEVVVIEDPVIAAPKKRGRKPAPKKSKVVKGQKASEETKVEEEVLETKVEEKEEAKTQVLGTTIEKTEATNSSSNVQEENAVVITKPKKRGRIKSFSPKKRK